MRLALQDARLSPADLDYINAHATGTQAGDVEEGRAIARVFGNRTRNRRLWVSSSKSMMGHLLGAAGAVEAALCVKAIETGVVPPTINLDNPDPECTLDLVPHQSRERRIRHAMSNSFGFGGTNATLVLSAWEG
jgi:3-oxoacyl-[acyl-carrier-protein] synthase II